MTTEQIIKRANLLVKVLQENHRGCGNPMTSEQGAKYLNEHGFSVKPKHIGRLINNIAIERCLPICYINAKGYFWATNRSEIQSTIADLQSRINALQYHIKHLKNFIVE